MRVFLPGAFLEPGAAGREFARSHGGVTGGFVYDGGAHIQEWERSPVPVAVDPRDKTVFASLDGMAARCPGRVKGM